MSLAPLRSAKCLSDFLLLMVDPIRRSLLCWCEPEEYLSLYWLPSVFTRPTNDGRLDIVSIPMQLWRKYKPLPSVVASCPAFERLWKAKQRVRFFGCAYIGRQDHLG